jgi:hypothetical protein
MKKGVDRHGVRPYFFGRQLFYLFDGTILALLGAPTNALSDRVCAGRAAVPCRRNELGGCENKKCCIILSFFRTSALVMEGSSKPEVQRNPTEAAAAWSSRGTPQNEIFEMETEGAKKLRNLIPKVAGFGTAPNPTTSS